MDVVEVLARCGGVARTDQLLRETTWRALEAGVSQGRIERVALGRYALPTAEAAPVAAARLSGTIAGLSAAVEHGFEVLVPPRRPCIAVPRNRKVDAHRRRGIDLVRWPVSGTLTPPLRTVLDCARTLPFGEGLAVADSAVRSGRVDTDELQVAAAGLRGGGAVGARRVADAATALAANPLESGLRAIALDVPGLHVEPQAGIELDGRTIHPDLVDRRLRLVVEAEGWLYHGNPEQFARDLRRYTGLVVAGWLVVRFGLDDVLHHPDRVREALESLVRTCTMRLDCPRCA